MAVAKRNLEEIGESLEKCDIKCKTRRWLNC